MFSEDYTLFTKEDIEHFSSDWNINEVVFDHSIPIKYIREIKYLIDPLEQYFQSRNLHIPVTIRYEIPDIEYLCSFDILKQHYVIY